MTKRKREMLCTNNMNGVALDMPERYYPTRIIYCGYTRVLNYT